LKNMKKILLLVLLLLSLCGCRHEQTEDIWIVYTNDVASTIDGDIGYAGLKGFRDHCLTENPYVALVDAGDFFDGDLALNCSGGCIMKLMEAVGYDAVAIGNQEFAIGLDALSRNMQYSDFPFLSCNIKYLGEGEDPLSYRQPYVIKQYGYTKVAFIGVTTPETITPGKRTYSILTKDGEPIYDFYGANEGQDLYEQVQKTVDSLRKKADYVVVLAHLGMNSVAKGYSSYELIANTTGIDVVIDAHSHTENAGEAVANKDGTNVILTSTGQKFAYIGLMKIHPDHTYTTAIYSSTNYYDDGIREMAKQIREEYGN